LPPQIVVHQIFLVNDNQHARYDATQREYKYFITMVRDPYLAKYTAYYGDKNIDMAKLEKAVKLIKSCTDFTNMCKQPDKNKHNVCTIFESKLDISRDKNLIKISLSANRFLRGMVRILMAKAIDCATSKITLDDFQLYLNNKIPRKFKDMAYPQGLYLSRIKYPYLDNDNASIMEKLLNTYFHN
jgi:tRNA pseudouridine38-40 synthase